VLPLLSTAVVTVLAAGGLALWRQRQERIRIEQRLKNYRQLCRAYEQNLGLPFWDRGQAEQALWARAASGDEQAWEILSSLHGQEPPFSYD
jgi:hypothetical protein